MNRIRPSMWPPLSWRQRPSPTNVSVFAARLTASVNFCFRQRFGRQSAEDCRAAARFRVDERLRPPCGAIEIGTNSINPCSEGCARFCRESTAMHTLADWVDQSSLTRLTATFVLVILAAVVSHLVKRHLWRTFVSGAETRFSFPIRDVAAHSAS